MPLPLEQRCDQSHGTSNKNTGNSAWQSLSGRARPMPEEFIQKGERAEFAMEQIKRRAMGRIPPEAPRVKLIARINVRGWHRIVSIAPPDMPICERADHAG